MVLSFCRNSVNVFCYFCCAQTQVKRTNGVSLVNAEKQMQHTGDVNLGFQISSYPGMPQVISFLVSLESSSRKPVDSTGKQQQGFLHTMLPQAQAIALSIPQPWYPNTKTNSNAQWKTKSAARVGEAANLIASSFLFFQRKQGSFQRDPEYMKTVQLPILVHQFKQETDDLQEVKSNFLRSRSITFSVMTSLLFAEHINQGIQKFK